MLPLAAVQNGYAVQQGYAEAAAAFRREAQLMAGARIASSGRLVDEFGTPYRYLTARPGAELLPSDIFGPRDGRPLWEYTPRFPRLGFADYFALPAAFRAVVPWEWSGDYFTIPRRPGLLEQDTRYGAADPRRFFLSVEQSNEPGALVSTFTPATVAEIHRAAAASRDVFGDVQRAGWGARMGYLRGDGWGRYNGILSSISGRPEPTQWRSSMADAIGGGFEYFAEQMGELAADIGAAFGAVASAVASVVGFIPGIGTGVAAALAAAGALASGQPIGDALMAAAANAIPGGGLAKMAFQSAAPVVVALADGKDIGEAALAGARGLAVANAGPLGAAAFDAGVAVAQGRALQDAGFAALRAFAKGNTLAERGIAYGETMAKAARQGRAIEDVLEDELGRELGRVAGGALRERLDPVLSKVVANPDLLNAGSEALALAQGVAEPIARAAQAIARTGQVDEGLKRRLLMSSTERAIERYGLKAAVTQGPTFEQAKAAEREAALTSTPGLAKVSWTGEKYGTTAAQLAAYDPSLSYRAQRAAQGTPIAPAPPAVTAGASTAPRRRSSVVWDVALGGVVAAAGVALYLWAKSDD